MVLARVRRSGFDEGEHRGHAVVVGPDGSVLRAWGDPDVVIFPRSSLKPAQAAGMVRAGLPLAGRLLALAASSHSGEPFHLAGVREILAGAGLDESALRTPPDWPYDPVEREERVRAGDRPRPLTMNCSGKHAAMLATCVANGWDVSTYPDPDHPLQRALRAEVEQLSGETVAHVGVDGCGAPVFAISLAGLARVASRCVTDAPGEPPRAVADAMREHPDWAAGTRRDVTALMRGVPGLVAKDGAEAVHVAALPDGTAVAVKVLDGGERARVVAMAAILRGLGVAAPVLDEQAEWPLLGGGRVVGAVSAAPDLVAR